MNTIKDVTAALPILRQFINPAQLSVLGSNCRGEEGQFFKDKLCSLAKLIESMPKTYEQDGKGDKAVVSLHYFRGQMDWYITEKDVDSDGEGQIQAFGLCNLGYGAELGYVSIAELIENGVELDLYFKPRTLAEIKAKRG